MTGRAPTTVTYEDSARQVHWCGVSMHEGEGFDSFVAERVAARLYDTEQRNEFEGHLRSLATTGFAQESLKAILEADDPEEYGWAIGEAIAEAYLEEAHAAIWPWNMVRDKRNPRASLPGADLVGFKVTNGQVCLAVGEVKTSSDTGSPPGVMQGRSGMAHQIDRLAHDLSLIRQLLKWLLCRCRGTQHEVSYNAATKRFLESGNKAAALFGVLIRDTAPRESDLKSRGQSLAAELEEPTTCELVGIYLPCDVDQLPDRLTGGHS